MDLSGSPPIRGEEGDDTDADDASDFNYPASGTEDQKQKIADRMRSWRMNTGGSGDVGRPKYDSGEIRFAKYDSGEIPRGYIPSVTNSQVGAMSTLHYSKRGGYVLVLMFLNWNLQISGEIPGASPDHHMMSPTGNIGKRASFPYVNHSCMLMSRLGLACLSLNHLFDVKISLLLCTSYQQIRQGSSLVVLGMLPGKKELMAGK
jgi:cellulose synthase A